MSSMTITIPEELADRLKPLEGQIPRILELGLRKINASNQTLFEGAEEVLELLASLPSPEEIIALRPSEDLQTRISSLLEKNRDQGLTTEEEKEWESYQYLEHLVRMAKAKAYMKMKNQ